MPSRLKSLELHGYKTFASLTRFEFAGTVTAIVGPNGSGKSNIADSLRWVLGEQSYTLLRGKKTEDMIFAGSEQRPKAGMASATIVFDNSDGWLPIDFSEVAITRRAYRDGENEYLLNGQKVRLRDVSELLAQSGLAERTYTIIGQGLVDAALALKAEERRRLFEEAAGIGLHRTRREEALKRLETTQRNLERVEDILAELQPRLRSLERQARRMQEYEQVKADLRGVLREWYGYHWHLAQKELREAREIARTQETALERVRGSQSTLDEKVELSRRRIQELRAGLGEWHRQSAQLHTQRESLSRDLAVADERMRALNQQRQAAVEELARLEEELGFYQERLAAAEQEVAQLQNELAEATSQVETARKSLAVRQAERAEAEKKVQAARQTLSGLTARQSHLQARLSERKAQAERQVEAYQSAVQAVSAGEKELTEAEVRLQSTTNMLKEAQMRRQASEEAFQDQRRRSTEAEARRKEIQENRFARSTESARLRAQIEVLDEAEKALTGYASGARLLIEAARQSRLKGVRGALSSQLEVSAEYETAIAAALGEYLDAILVDSCSTAEQALAILEGQPSRASLLPMDALLPVSDGHLSTSVNDLEGFIAPAANLVHVPKDLEPAVQLLLGQVWVVRDRPAAQRFLEKLQTLKRSGENSLLERIVTLRGEVFYCSGPILAGQEGKPGTLSRPRQRKELQAKLEALDAQIRSLDGHSQQLEEALKALRSEGDRLGAEAQQRRKQEEQARTSHSQQDLVVEKARRQLQWQREQHERLEAEIKRGNQEASQVSNELERLESEIAQAREILRGHNNTLSSLSLEESQIQLSHWNTRAAVAERAAAEAVNRHKERQAALERATRTCQGLEARLVENQSQVAALEQEKVAWREKEISISEEIEDLQLLIEPAELELETAEREQAGLMALEGEARQGLSLAEHRHSQAKITLARRQESLDSLQRRIEDDFGLVAFEYSEDMSGQTPLPLEGMVEQLPRVSELNPEIDEIIKNKRAQLRRMGPINPEAQAEYKEVKERFEFLTTQVADLKKAEVDIREVIAELDLLMEREFRKTFEAVAQEFRAIFTRLFGGGSARLILTDPEDLTDTGIDIEARLPGRRTQGLSLLSGGERSLTATSLVFALLKVSPTPFCVLDEVDAMLDEANVGRFRDLLRELSQNTQFIVVTHNRNTVQVADVIYGITMGHDSSSQVLSLKLDQVSQIVDQ